MLSILLLLCDVTWLMIKGILRPNNNQLHSDYMSLLIPTEYLQYLWIILTINFIFSKLFKCFFLFSLFAWTNDETDSEDFPQTPRLFGDILAYNVTNIYTSVFTTTGLAQFQIQNFLNFFISTMFWLSFIPFAERLYPVFFEKNYNEQFTKLGFADVPDFNVTVIYQQTYFPDTIAIQLLQNFFNWFTGTVVWFPFMMMYDRMYPIFSTENNQRSLEDSQACDAMLYLLATNLVTLLRLFAGFTTGIQRWFFLKQ